MYKYSTNKDETQVSSNPHTQNTAKLKKRPKLNTHIQRVFAERILKTTCEIRKTLLVNF